MTVLMLGLLEDIQLVLLVLQRASHLLVRHEARHDVDGDGENDRAETDSSDSSKLRSGLPVVLSRDAVESLEISQL